MIQWMIDLAQRMKQLQTVSKVTNASGAKELKNLKVWLGGLFIPEAYITATRQYVAQANQWSLEELYLTITIADNSAQSLQADDCSFIVTGRFCQDFITCIPGIMFTLTLEHYKYSKIHKIQKLKQSVVRGMFFAIAFS